jgi:flagellar hook capping protein FlgD
MEGTTAKWVWESPNPGSLWHLESAPGTSIPANCFFLSSNVWVPFQGSGFGFVPDWVDAMLTTPPMDIQGVFSPNNPTTGLTIQFDDWVNLPDENAVYWSLQISGSNDLTTWTPWRNTGSLHIGGNPNCAEGATGVFDPYDTPVSGIQPGTRYIRLGFRLRDEKANSLPAGDGAPLFLGVRTEGIYFDNIGVYNIYTISGVETVPGLPTGTHAAIRKAFPNPFNPSTTLELSVPKQGTVAVRIFDLQGRRVATLLDESMNAGVYRVRWNGQDDQGRTQSSGIYFAQIQSGGSRQSVRLTMLK